MFTSIHSFLSHCALASKLLKAEDDSDPPVVIGEVLRVRDSSIIHNRTFRDHLDHYYDRLKRWIEKYPTDVSIGTYNVGPKQAFKVGNMVLISHYDPTTEVFTFVDEDLNLREMYEEVSKIKTMADTWVKSLRQSMF